MKRMLALSLILSLFVVRSEAVIFRNDTDIDLQVSSHERFESYKDTYVPLNRNTQKSIPNTKILDNCFLFRLSTGKEIAIPLGADFKLNDDAVLRIYTECDAESDKEVVIECAGKELDRLPIEHFRDEKYEKQVAQREESIKAGVILLGFMAVWAGLKSFMGNVNTCPMP